MDLELAAVARARIDVADGEGAMKAFQDFPAQRFGYAQRFVGLRRGFGPDAGGSDLSEELEAAQAA